MEEATFRGQILEEEGPEAGFFLDEVRFSKMIIGWRPHLVNFIRKENFQMIKEILAFLLFSGFLSDSDCVPAIKLKKLNGALGFQKYTGLHVRRAMLWKVSDTISSMTGSRLYLVFTSICLNKHPKC